MKKLVLIGVVAAIFSSTLNASPTCVAINRFELGAGQCFPDAPYVERVECSCPCNNYPRFKLHGLCSECLHFYYADFH